jgi:hypothetical protein
VETRCCRSKGRGIPLGGNDCGSPKIPQLLPQP